MLLYPTASRSALLLQCSYPFSVPDGFTRELLPEERSHNRDEAAAYGLDFHAAMDGKKSRSGTRLPKGVIEHAKESTRVLDRWREREGWTSGAVLREASFVYTPDIDVGTQCEGPDEENHIYPGHRPLEIRMTLDFAVEQRERILIVDYKTGSDDDGEYATPNRLAQLRTIGLAASAHAKTFNGKRKRVQLAVLHAPRDGHPVLYADPEEPESDLLHRENLRTAINRIEDGSLRPGRECKYCPARSVCPTRGTDMLDYVENAFGIIVSKGQAISEETDGALAVGEKLGLAWEIERAAKKMSEACRDLLKREVRAGKIPVLKDGRILEFVKRTRKNLSMSAMTRQIGAKAAQREFKRLEKLGAIETTIWEELRALED